MTLLERALFEHQSGKLESAIALYLQSVTTMPDPAVFHNLGVAYAQSGQLQAAKHAYQESLRLRPFNKNTRNNLGLLLQEMGELFEAEEVLRSLLSDDTRNIDVATNLTGVLLEQGRPDVAIPLLTPLVQMAGHHPSGWDSLGACFLEIGDLDMALSIFVRAYQQDPRNPVILFHLYTALFESAPHKAMELLRHGIKQHPDQWYWHFHLHAAEQWLFNHSSTPLPVETPDWWIDSLDYALEHRTAETSLHTSTKESLRTGITQAHRHGLCMEFGTRFGTSARMIRELSQQKLFVFDSFQGLPTDWHTVAKGAYTTQGVVPNLGEDVEPVIGWYSASLPPFLEQHSDLTRFIHIDCDLYSSTKDVFDHLAPRLQSGTVIAFDEYFMGPHWREDEWKAWIECVQQNDLSYEYLSFSFITRQSVVKIS